MPTTSPSLLARLRKPVPESWDRFVDLFTPLLYAWAQRTGLVEADAAAVVQDVFAALHEQLPSFEARSGAGFRDWLKTVARGSWLARIRKLGPVPVGAGDPGPAAPAERFWDEEYRSHLVRRAWELVQSEFEPGIQEVCRRCLMEGKPASEVADQLGLRVGIVHAAQARVLRRLREELSGFLD